MFLPGDAQRRRLPPEKDLWWLHEDIQASDLPKDLRDELSEYDLRIVGDDARAAIAVARRILRGLEHTDLCDANSGLCEGNLGIPRDYMPQIDGAKIKKGKTVLESFIEALVMGGTRVVEISVHAGILKATQAELWADKVYKMADAMLSGEMSDDVVPIVISSDWYILDGHHRWAATMVIDPMRKIDVLKIDLPIRELLLIALDHPGVTIGGSVETDDAIREVEEQLLLDQTRHEVLRKRFVPDDGSS